MQGDASAPTTIATTFVKANGVAENYVTRLDPVALAIPGMSSAQGADIGVLDVNENQKSMWNGYYKTAIGESKLYVKDQQSMTRPSMFIVVAGNNNQNMVQDLDGASKEGSTGNTDEAHKIVVTDWPEGTFRASTESFEINQPPEPTAIYVESGGMGVWYAYSGVHARTDFPFIGCIDTPAGRHIVLDKDKKTCIAYTRKSTTTGLNEAIYRETPDGGLLWSGWIISTSSYDQSWVQIVLDKNGTKHFVWAEAVPYYMDVGDGPQWYYEYRLRYKNVDRDGNWTSSVTISRTDTNYTGFQQCPIMQVKPDGLSIGVVWLGTVANGDDYILYRERAADGTWGSIENASTTVTTVPSLDYDDDGNPHCISVGLMGVYYYYKSDGTWQAAARIGTDGYNGTYPPPYWPAEVSNLYWDLKGNLNAIYSVMDMATTKYILRFIRKVGSSWTTPATMLNDSGRYAQIQGDDKYNLYIYTTYLSGSYYVGLIIKSTYNMVAQELTTFTATSKDIMMIATVCTRLPKIDNVYSQLLQDYGCLLLAVANDSSHVTGKLYFTAHVRSVGGAIDLPNQHDTYTTRIRGVFAREKFQQNLFAPAMFG
jgi:hypothetical protein